MKTSYHLTIQGLKYAIASNEKNDVRYILMFILRFYSNTAISFYDIQAYYEGNKKKAFKQVCHCLDMQLIVVDEVFEEAKEVMLTKPQLKEKFVISDMNGLVIDYLGYDVSQANKISIDAIDFIRVSQRNCDVNRVRPLSIETLWQDEKITTYHLFLKNYNFLLSCKSKEFFNQPQFIPLISYFVNRYNYD